MSVWRVEWSDRPPCADDRAADPATVLLQGRYATPIQDSREDPPRAGDAGRGPDALASVARQPGEEPERRPQARLEPQAGRLRPLRQRLRRDPVRVAEQLAH